jgi:hypothetical protein
MLNRSNLLNLQTHDSHFFLSLRSGGMNDDDVYDDVWHFDLASSKWQQAAVQ